MSFRTGGINVAYGSWGTVANDKWPLTLNLLTNEAIFGGNLNAVSITSVGNVTAYFSDQRLKTFVANIKDPLTIINKLKGFYYRPNEVAKSNGFTHFDTEIGLSAQDVQKVLPEIVKLAPFDSVTDDDGNVTSKSGNNYLTMSYERLAPVFVEAIKALKKEVDVLRESQNELDELRKFKKEFEEFKKKYLRKE